MLNFTPWMEIPNQFYHALNVSLSWSTSDLHRESEPLEFPLRLPLATQPKIVAEFIISEIQSNRILLMEELFEARPAHLEY